MTGNRGKRACQLQKWFLGEWKGRQHPPKKERKGGADTEKVAIKKERRRPYPNKNGPNKTKNRSSLQERRKIMGGNPSKKKNMARLTGQNPPHSPLTETKNAAKKKKKGDQSSRKILNQREKAGTFNKPR